jgi:hypothetical protein
MVKESQRSSGHTVTTSVGGARPVGDLVIEGCKRIRNRRWYVRLVAQAVAAQERQTKRQAETNIGAQVGLIHAEGLLVPLPGQGILIDVMEAVAPLLVVPADAELGAAGNGPCIGPAPDVVGTGVVGAGVVQAVVV